nr:PREDICTED: receptor-like protein 12 [Daucus carota subsp. sativus]
MTELINLSLFDNQLTGSISSSFSQLINLDNLNLKKNNFSGIVEADVFLSLEKLTFLSLSQNNISLLTNHLINSTLSHFTGLELDSCNLKEIPYFLKFQDKLETLSLTGNSIHGQVPAWLWNASDSLVEIYLFRNFLTGMGQNLSVLPGTSLRVIDIKDNMLKGNLPVPPTTIMAYYVANNKLTGEIPSKMCGLRSLKILHLFNNNMTGPIPSCLGNSLSVFNVGGNNFSGMIPQSYSEKCDLRVMDLSQNRLEGQLPRSLSNCRMLRILDLGDNKLEDTFPSWLGTLPQLQVLILHANRFWGATASSPGIGSPFPMLQIIDVSQNSFSGDLPLEYIKNWSAMKFLPSDMELYAYTRTEFQSGKHHWTDTYSSSLTLRNKGVTAEYAKHVNVLCAIDFSSNRFTGKIPDSLGSLKQVQMLNLANNELTGPIPPSLGSLRQLESLDLSVNKLSGAIPHQIAAELNFLSFFNVSYNTLSGPIPQGPQFRTFEKDSYIGNLGLCGLPLSKKCASAKSPEPDNEDVNDSDESLNVSDWAFILTGIGTGLVIGYVLGTNISKRHPWLILKVAEVLTRRSYTRNLESEVTMDEITIFRTNYR